MKKRNIVSAYLITSIILGVMYLLLEPSFNIQHQLDALAKPVCVEIIELMETKGVNLYDISAATREPQPIAARIVSGSFSPWVCIGVFAAVLVLLKERTRGTQNNKSNRVHTTRTQFEHARFNILQIDTKTRTILSAFLITSIAFGVMWLMGLSLGPSLFNHARLDALEQPGCVEIIELMETKGVTISDIQFATWEPSPIGVHIVRRISYWFYSPLVYIGVFVAVLVLLEKRTRRKQHKAVMLMKMKTIVIRVGAFALSYVPLYFLLRVCSALDQWEWDQGYRTQFSSANVSFGYMIYFAILILVAVVAVLTITGILVAKRKQEGRTGLFRKLLFLYIYIPCVVVNVLYGTILSGLLLPDYWRIP